MNKTVFVLNDNRKFFNKKITEFVESKKPFHEISIETSENITPLNHYFEPVNLIYNLVSYRYKFNSIVKR